ncbi:interleukin-20 receptor subunit alpha [Pseudorasbora parva]|uniref:interleukin-20 receptor subunit alpha n=1 Tax=Pseudorasbora parva TaxID=51549 RepID=UPI00351E41A1
MEELLVLALCLLCPVSSERLPEPQNVHFSSVNLRNLVKWTPGDGSPNGTIYSVEYAIYGDAKASGVGQLRWRRVKQCSSITQSQCDVSQETFDQRDEYFARVRAVSAHTQSLWSESAARFNPLTDTVLGAPLVELHVLQNYINISIKGPFRWRTKKMKKEESLWKIFPDMIYGVSVFNSRRNHTGHMRLVNGSVMYGPVEFSTQICVTAHAESESLPLAYSPSEPLCTHTPKDPFRDQLLAALLGGVLPSALCVCVLCVLAGFIHCYITDHRQTLPKSARVDGTSAKLQTFQPEMPPTIIVNVIRMGCFEDECSPLFPAALPPPVPDEAQALIGAPPPPVSYARQNAAGSAPEDSRREEPLHNEAGEYGIVIRAPAEVSPYRTQGPAIEPQDTCEDEEEDKEEEEEEEQEEAQIFLDWSPMTQELKFPLMGLLGLEDEPQIQPAAVSLLPNVILRQSSADEQDDDFSKMERDWGLIIHSNTD